MKIHVHREACCSQDDQLGPLAQAYELREDCSLGDFVTAVMGSRFLQYSSTHTTLRCLVGPRQVATVFSPYLEPARETVYAVPLQTLMRDLARDGVVEFEFERPAQAGT